MRKVVKLIFECRHPIHGSMFNLNRQYLSIQRSKLGPRNSNQMSHRWKEWRFGWRRLLSVPRLRKRWHANKTRTKLKFHKKKQHTILRKVKYLSRNSRSYPSCILHINKWKAKYFLQQNRRRKKYKWQVFVFCKGRAKFFSSYTRKLLRLFK